MFHTLNQVKSSETELTKVSVKVRLQLVKTVKKGLLLILILLAFVLGSQNPVEVKVNYILASSTLPLATILAITLMIGLIIGCLLGTVSSLNTKSVRLSHKDKAPEESITK